MCSDNGYENASDLGECKDAAKQFQKIFEKEKNSQYPKGCYQYGNIYWNTHDVGQHYNGTHPICKISGKF